MDPGRQSLFQRRDIVIGLYLFVCIISVYLLAMNGNIRGDGRYHYVAALGLLSGKLPVVENYRYFDVRAPLDKRGERTVQYGVGWSATLMPVVLVYDLLFGRLPLPPDNKLLRMVISSTTSFISAGTAVLLYLTLRKMGHRRRTCVLAALLLAFSTMLWTYSRGDLWTEPATAFAITAALLAAVQHRKSGSPISAIVAGLFVAYALTIKIYWAFLIVPFLVLLAGDVAHRNLRTVGGFLLPFVVAVGAICFYNKLRFGVVVAEGYLGGALTLEAVGQAIKGQPLLNGLYGLLFSSGKSVLLFNPPVIMGLFGVRQFWRESRQLAVFWAILLGGYLLFFASRPTWGGGYVWGPRHLAPLLPVMILPLAHVIDTNDSGSRRVRIWLCLVLAAGIVMQIPNLFIYSRAYTTPMLHDGWLHWEEIYFVPNRSPIVRNWIILKDASVSLFTREPLFFYPVRVMRGNVDVLQPFYAPDFADTWDSWINIVRRAGYMELLAMRAAVFTIVGLLVCTAMLAGYGIRKNLREAAALEQDAEAGVDPHPSQAAQ